MRLVKFFTVDFWNWLMMMWRLRIQKLKMGNWGGFEKIDFFSFFLMRKRLWRKKLYQFLDRSAPFTLGSIEKLDRNMIILMISKTTWSLKGITINNNSKSTILMLRMVGSISGWLFGSFSLVLVLIRVFILYQLPHYQRARLHFCLAWSRHGIYNALLVGSRVRWCVL